MLPQKLLHRFKPVAVFWMIGQILLLVGIDVEIVKLVLIKVVGIRCVDAHRVREVARVLVGGGSAG